MIFDAYWITPDGEVIHVKGRRHIEIIISDPDKFGESLMTITREYKDNNEPLGYEGKARQVIMYRVISRGYIRIRQQRNQWMIQVWNISEDTMRSIRNWASTLKGQCDLYADMVIDQLGESDTGQLTMPFSELLS